MADVVICSKIRNFAFAKTTLNSFALCICKNNIVVKMKRELIVVICSKIRNFAFAKTT